MMRKVSLLSLYITLIISGVLVFGSSQIAFADIIIDLDGIATDGIGVAADQEVFSGAPLQPWPAPSNVPLPPPGQRAGIDWVDRDNTPVGDAKTWSDGDSLFSEDADLCPTAIRDQKFNAPLMLGGPQRDCLILEGPLGAIPDNLLTDCDLESGGSPSGLFQNPPCQDRRLNVQLAFYDLPDPNNNNMPNGFWNNGEDIVLDFLPFDTFEPELIVGGHGVPIDKTALMVTGAQMTTTWMIPWLVAAIGFGLVIAKKFRN